MVGARASRRRTSRVKKKEEEEEKPFQEMTKTKSNELVFKIFSAEHAEHNVTKESVYGYQHF